MPSTLVTFLCGLVFGLSAEWMCRRIVAHWTRPVCEICGGKPYAVHMRAGIMPDGQLVDERSVMLCESCSAENLESTRREIEAWQGGEEE